MAYPGRRKLDKLESAHSPLFALARLLVLKRFIGITGPKIDYSNFTNLKLSSLHRFRHGGNDCNKCHHSTSPAPDSK